MHKRTFISLIVLAPLFAGLVACGEKSEPITSGEAMALSEVATAEVESADTDSTFDAAVSEEIALASPDSLIEAIPEDIDMAPDPVVEPIATASFKLRHGETLHYFAKWSELPVEDIAEASSLSLDGSYPVGTVVEIPSDGIDVAAVEAARQAHWTTRIDGYMASRGGEAGTDFYTVATGDTAWGIARDAQGIPIWLLAAYNPEVGLDSLHPGDKLMVPILADIVVDAEPAVEDTSEPSPE